MEDLWLELGDSVITAISIHFMAWSDKSATARCIKPKRARQLDRRRVVRFVDCHAFAHAQARHRGFCFNRRASQPLRLLVSGPCPRSGLFIHGELDRVAPLKEVIEQIDKLKTYKDALIEHALVRLGF